MVSGSKTTFDAPEDDWKMTAEREKKEQALRNLVADEHNKIALELNRFALEKAVDRYTSEGVRLRDEIRRTDALVEQGKIYGQHVAIFEQHCQTLEKLFAVQNEAMKDMASAMMKIASLIVDENSD